MCCCYLNPVRVIQCSSRRHPIFTSSRKSQMPQQHTASLPACYNIKSGWKPVCPSLAGQKPSGRRCVLFTYYLLFDKSPTGNRDIQSLTHWSRTYWQLACEPWQCRWCQLSPSPKPVIGCRVCCVVHRAGLHLVYTDNVLPRNRRISAEVLRGGISKSATDLGCIWRCAASQFSEFYASAKFIFVTKERHKTTLAGWYRDSGAMWNKDCSIITLIMNEGLQHWKCFLFYVNL